LQEKLEEGYDVLKAKLMQYLDVRDRPAAHADADLRRMLDVIGGQGDAVGIFI